jgi:hypothetical protein
MMTKREKIQTEIEAMEQKIHGMEPFLHFPILFSILEEKVALDKMMAECKSNAAALKEKETLLDRVSSLFYLTIILSYFAFFYFFNFFFLFADAIGERTIPGAHGVDARVDQI